MSFAGVLGAALVQRSFCFGTTMSAARDSNLLKPNHTDAARYGPNNPHPLSTLKTEIVWEGKYDEYGNRREVDVAGCTMPLQRIETVDQRRGRSGGSGEFPGTTTVETSMARLCKR